ncbi:pentatricopeptide repeat domain-containing protein [Stagonosporopsis vannaccii]|nr:pentatricopeptide repeat domain-containing protein [Stagonosporopsis vannaccii]
MLALWSRAALNPGSCRCIVSGRRTLRAHNGSRSSRPSPAGVHSTIAAADITIDAQQAQQRVPLWDEAVESLKEALERPVDRPLTVRGHAHAELESVAHTPLERLPSDLDWAQVTRVAGMDLADDQKLFHRMHSRAYDDPQGAWDDLRWDSRFPGMQQLQWPANTGHRVKPYNLPPQSLWAPDVARMAAMRRRHTWKKLTMQELCTAVLIHSLLRRVKIPRQPLAGLSPQIESVATLSDKHAWKARKDILNHVVRLHLIPVDAVIDDVLQAQIYPDQQAIPRYHQDSDGDFYETTQQLNNGLKDLLHHESRDRKADEEAGVALAKICHNLFVSSAPPDVQTFNILIAGFKRWRRPDMVDDVILAFHGSKIRPNEITLRSILGHYISERRPDGFSRFVAWMRGVSDALMLADPDVAINEASQGRLVRISEKKVYQKVYPTPMVFGALIGGVLKFGGFERALDVYYEMKADGWGLDMAGLTRLLGDCIRRADWQGGVYIWAEINSIKDMAMPKDMAKAYEFMLSLCSVTGNTSAFNQLLKEIVNRGYDRHTIISGALKTTRWAQAKRTNLAPAWAADNLLIAVSSFVKDLKEPEPGATPDFSIDDLMYGQPTVEGDNDLPIDNVSDWDDAVPVAVSEQRVTDPNETWASWVEAEFGERPKDPDAHDWLAATSSKPVDEEPGPTASKEVWEKWLEAEFGEKPNDSKP